MARVTVEDCLKEINNHFELVNIAAKRARQIVMQGKDPLVSENGNKACVITLREIASGKVNAAFLDKENQSNDFIEDNEY